MRISAKTICGTVLWFIGNVISAAAAGLLTKLESGGDFAPAIAGGVFLLLFLATAALVFLIIRDDIPEPNKRIYSSGKKNF